MRAEHKVERPFTLSGLWIELRDQHLMSEGADADVNVGGTAPIARWEVALEPVSPFAVRDNCGPEFVAILPVGTGKPELDAGGPQRRALPH